MQDRTSPRIMSRVRGRGNKATELRMLDVFRQNRITGWRRHKRIFGKPDFIFLKARLAVFVDGCFWHGCPKHASEPASNRGFWRRKLERNKVRDRLVNRTLKYRGWRVLRVWQHELSQKNEPRLVSRIQRTLALLNQKSRRSSKRISHL